MVSSSTTTRAMTCLLYTSTRDILTQVTVPKAPRRVAYQSQRNISTDFPVLTCALSERDGAHTCVIGARPMPCLLYTSRCV